MSRIALINLSTLERMAIIGELDRLSDASYLHFRNFVSFKASNEKAEGFIVSANEFINNIDFFLPRKTRTVIISEHTFSGEIVSMEEGMLNVINSDTDPTIVDEMIVSLASIGRDEKELGDISTREKEVLRELAKGKTNKEIADILCISVNTVITHRKNLSTKLGIRSVSGLSLYAMMNGII